MTIIKLSAAFEDERGSIWDLLTDEEIHHVGFLISKKIQFVENTIIKNKLNTQLF